MKTTILLFISAVYLLLPQRAAAQGTLYVSNLGQTPTDSAAIGSDSWIAQRFIMGVSPNGNSLNSIQLLMNAASGSPSNFVVSIYSSLGGVPASNLGNLTGSDPSAGGIFTYTASGITLSASTIYFVVLTSATDIANGAYSWSAANGETVGSSGIIDDVYFSSPDGLSWTGYARQDVFQMAIYATPVPEPSTYALAGLGLAILSFLRRKHVK
jgi:hypothetical protein